MKKINFLVLISLIVLTVLNSCQKDDPEPVINNPYTVKINGEEVDGRVFSYTEVGSQAKMGFQITNNESSDLTLKIKVVSLNGDGTGIELCFNSCAPNINLYYEELKTLSAGQVTTTAGTHLTNASDGSSDFSATLRITQVDASGNDLTSGKVVEFTYEYTAP